MKTILKYLLDEGGQFWGNFAQSYAASVERARDRPLKEAMMKANIAHQQAVADKAQMDIQQERQQQAAVADLSTLLTTPQPSPNPAAATVSMPTTEPAMINAPAPADKAAVGEALKQPQTINKPVEMTDPRVRSALLKSGVKGEVLSQAAKAAFPSSSAVDKFGVSSLAEAQQMEMDPNFRAMFPHGHRWTTKNGKLVPEGINPVDVASNEFHSDIAAGMKREDALQKYFLNTYGKASSAAQGGVAGKAAQQLTEPVAPMQPMAGATPAAPGVQNVGTPAQQPTPGAPSPMAGGPAGESPTMRAERLKKGIAREEAPIPEGLAKQQRDYTTLLNTTIADIENNFDASFLGARGLPGVQALRENAMTGGALEKMGIVNKPSEKETIFRAALADASDMLLRARSGAQINEQEAKRLEKLLPAADSDEKTFRAKFARFKQQVKASIENGKLFGNVSRSQLQSMGTGTPNPTPVPGATGGGKQLPSDWEFTGK